jgi:hypothetical protein
VFLYLIGRILIVPSQVLFRSKIAGFASNLPIWETFPLKMKCVIHATYFEIDDKDID